jgi:hypothetical protein
MVSKGEAATEVCAYNPPVAAAGWQMGCLQTAATATARQVLLAASQAWQASHPVGLDHTRRLNCVSVCGWCIYVTATTGCLLRVLGANAVDTVVVMVTTSSCC